MAIYDRIAKALDAHDDECADGCDKAGRHRCDVGFYLVKALNAAHHANTRKGDDMLREHEVLEDDDSE